MDKPAPVYIQAIKGRFKTSKPNQNPRTNKIGILIKRNVAKTFLLITELYALAVFF